MKLHPYDKWLPLYIWVVGFLCAWMLVINLIK